MIFKFVAWISFQMAFHLVVSECFYMPRTYDYWFWNVYVRFSHVFHGHICIIDRENVLWSIGGQSFINFVDMLILLKVFNSLSS
jgi:hypothetical protein